MVRAELPFGLRETLYAAGPGVSLERAVGQRLFGLGTDEVIEFAKGVEVTLPGTGTRTSAALTARAGAWELVPLARPAPAWEDTALRSTHVQNMSPRAGELGSNLTPLDHDVVALLDDGFAVRPTGAGRA
ncbi:MAG: hypothetical protein JWM98_2532 [Thermoleophilia bacterium]|nr:hypothetical protein [Thermoleophilia bacterium]